MVSEGGLSEALDLFSSLENHNFEKGILQSIGYKEFYDVYNLKKPDQVLEYIANGVPFDQSNVVEDCIVKLENKTMQYAQYQLKWLESRMSVFGADTLIRLRLEDYQCLDDLKRKAQDFVQQCIDLYKTLTDDQALDFL